MVGIAKYELSRKSFQCGIGDTAKNVLCSPSKVPLIIERSQPDLTPFTLRGCRMRGV
jgi:hypothetical protein